VACIESGSTARSDRISEKEPVVVDSHRAKADGKAAVN
jgi:hypothetical protein